jgi:NADH:ubiquinone oxidoreductase subunit 6 (subunit J)
LNSKNTNFQTKAILANLIAPGIGQFVQKRWLSGGIYLLATLIGFCWLLYVFVNMMIQSWESAMNGTEMHYPLKEIFISMASIFFVWIISYIDIFIFAPKQKIESDELENDKEP